MRDVYRSQLRNQRLWSNLLQAEAHAAAGEQVAWVHPEGSPPPEWVAKRLRAAGVRIQELKPEPRRRPPPLIVMDGPFPDD